jgi:cytochrome b
MKRILVWDVPTRMFHAAFGSCLLLAFALSHGGEHSSAFAAHMGFGVLVGVLCVWRVVWGFVGSRYARFDSFALGPASLLRYLSSLFGPDPSPEVGHNPASSWATLGMLLLALGLAVSGVSIAAGMEAFGEVHELLAFAVLLVAAIHVVGVILSEVRHPRSLLRALLDGHKLAASDAGISSGRLWTGAALAVAFAVVAVVVFSGVGSDGTLSLVGLTLSPEAAEEEAREGRSEGNDDEAEEEQEEHEEDD